MQTVLDTGAALIQNRGPIEKIHQHICGVHFYSGDMSRQVIAHHYCHHLSADMHQCVIYDSDQPDARLIGIEYIVSEKLFMELPDDEKKLWHSHDYEVRGGIITAPGLPLVVEHKLMSHLHKTYGKVFHTWQVDRGDKVPLGIPQLMMSFTGPNQANDHLIQKTSPQELIENRSDLPPNVKVPGADAWENGFIYQTNLESKTVQRLNDEVFFRVKQDK
ncbi:hypothetical protein PROFUN_01932 [Planoprotostelium fungivorum]|uniref:DUF1264 domain-containing protein n=1 Tax=Planoprotostelium fungivorum TaxID=1890364 RepID=A0A2P6NZ39_9EUKA|nr:hypothetical protein PROFUN_01932 [Planoprotostelium fungivorum]